MFIRAELLRVLSVAMIVVPFILAACNKGGTPGY